MAFAIAFLVVSGVCLIVGGLVLHPEDNAALVVGRVIPVAAGVGNLVCAGFLYLSFFVGVK